MKLFLPIKKFEISLKLVCNTVYETLTFSFHKYVARMITKCYMIVDGREQASVIYVIVLIIQTFGPVRA